MDASRRLLLELFKQLDASDAYAKDENPSRVPSVWQIQNGLLRDKARDVLASLPGSAA